MGFWDRFSGRHLAEFEERLAELETQLEARSLQAWWTDDIDAPMQTTAGARVSRTSILGLSAAWAAVCLLADSISTLPVDVILDEGDRRVPSPERPRWLDEPGQDLSRIDVLGQMLVSLLTEGDALVLTPRSEGQVQGLTVLDPAEVILDPDGSYSAVGVDILPGEILHIRGLMLPTSRPEQRRGVGPVTYAREALGAALATQTFGAAFFGNGAWVGTTVEVPGPLSSDGQKAIRTYVNERHRGSSNAHRIGILTEGAKLSRPLTFSPEDSQFLQTREFQVADVARLFRVPPEMIGGKSGDSLTYATLEGRSTHFVTYSLLHWLIRLERAFTGLWRSEGGPENGEVKLNVKGLLRGSTKERYDAYAVGLDKGFLTIDEVRALEDLPPKPKDEVMPNADAAM